jgi:BirA family biotin operon repressor/biotin-[acetyl-CoA-carboxylase] ligase
MKVNNEKPTRYRLLEALKEAPGLLSGDELASMLGVSRVAVWKGAHSLAAEGHRIRIGKNGYSYEHGGDPLGTSVLEGRVRFARSASSTMDMARDALRRGESAGYAAVAEEQTAGRARYGAWPSYKGGLYLSYIAEPGLPYSFYGRVALSACVVAIRALEEHGLEGLAAAWPGDIMAGDEKIGGVLIEAHSEHGRVMAVIGIGVAPSRARYPRAETIAALLRSLDAMPWLERDFIDAWESRASDIGAMAVARTPWALIEGRIMGVGEDASLRLSSDGAEALVHYGFAIERCRVKE